MDNYLFFTIIFFIVQNYTVVFCLNILCSRASEKMRFSLVTDFTKIFRASLIAVATGFLLAGSVNILVGWIGYCLVLGFFMKRFLNFLNFIDLSILILVNSVALLILKFLSNYPVVFNLIVFLFTVGGFYHMAKIVGRDKFVEDEKVFIENQKLKILKLLEEDQEFRTWCYLCVNFNGKYCIKGYDREKVEMSAFIKNKHQTYCLHWVEAEFKEEGGEP